MDRERTHPYSFALAPEYHDSILIAAQFSALAIILQQTASFYLSKSIDRRSSPKAQTYLIPLHCIATSFQTRCGPLKLGRKPNSLIHVEFADWVLIV